MAYPMEPNLGRLNPETHQNHLKPLIAKTMKENRMKKMTTLGKVFDRVDELSRNCTDRLIKVEDISFDSLDSVKINGERHLLRTIAQRSIAYRLAIPFQYLRRCPPEVQAYNMNQWQI